MTGSVSKPTCGVFRRYSSQNAQSPIKPAFDGLHCIGANLTSGPISLQFLNGRSFAAPQKLSRASGACLRRMISIRARRSLLKRDAFRAP